MKIDLSDKKALVFFLLIVVLVAINLFLIMQPAKPQSQLSLYKQFAQQTHSAILQLRVEAQNSDNVVATADMNAEEKQYVALMAEFKKSMLSDLDWLKTKENAVYWPLVASNNPLEANGLMRKEIALLVIANYVFGLNNDAITDGTTGLLDSNDAIEEANASLSWITVKDLLNDEFAQELISETLVQKEDIISETKSLMAEYLELQKQKFKEAKAGTNAQYVESIKLLELGYLLEINSSN
jgi:hypothetical protein